MGMLCQTGLLVDQLKLSYQNEYVLSIVPPASGLLSWVKFVEIHAELDLAQLQPRLRKESLGSPRLKGLGLPSNPIIIQVSFS